MLFIFGLGGIIKSINFKNETIYYLIVFTLITPAIFLVAPVETRYRFQIYPLLAIFAAYFIVHLFSQPKPWRSKLLWLSAGIIFFNGAIDFALSLERLKERLNLFF